MGTFQLRNVNKSFGATTIIPNLDLDIEDGEFVVFVGPSGCGKSTLLRLIAGLEDTTGGKIVIDGRDVTDESPAKRQLAMVFQSYALYPHMTVGKNIAFPLKMAGEDQASIDKKVANAARILNLTNYLERRPGQLSGGQRQRVAIGRAIVRNPAAFLFDEPLSNLDAALRGTMRLEISELHQQLGKTMIYVTHDQVEAMTMADKIVVLNAGNIEQVGSPLELYRNPKNRFVAGFIGSPTMNFIEGAEAAKHGAQDHRRPPRAHRRLDHADRGRLEGHGRRRRAPRRRHLHPRQRRRARHPQRPRLGEVPVNHGDTVYLTPRPDRDPPLRRQPAWRSAMRLEGKSALITGAARGIGAAFAGAYAAEGATVAIGDIALDRAEATAAAIGPNAYAVRLDVTDQASIDAAVAAVVERAGGLDILVNNAALFDLAPIVEITRESYDRLFRINVAGTLFTMQAAARQMIAQGRGGKIINMASQAGRRGEALVAVYCATKAAVISLTQSAGLDLIRHRINVNAIAPGVVDGEHWDGVDALFAKYENRPLGEKKRLVGESVPYGRMGTAEDLVGMAVFLASRRPTTSSPRPTTSTAASG